MILRIALEKQTGRRRNKQHGKKKKNRTCTGYRSLGRGDLPMLILVSRRRNEKGRGAGRWAITNKDKISMCLPNMVYT